MQEPRVELLLIATHPYSAMLDACAVITALPWAVGNLIKFDWMAFILHFPISPFILQSLF